MIALPIFAFLPTLHLNLGLRITHCLEEVWSLCPSTQRSAHAHTTHLHITPSIFSKTQFDKWLILLDEQRAVGGSLSFFFFLSDFLSVLFVFCESGWGGRWAGRMTDAGTLCYRKWRLTSPYLVISAVCADIWYTRTPIFINVMNT